MKRVQAPTKRGKQGLRSDWEEKLSSPASRPLQFWGPRQPWRRRLLSRGALSPDRWSAVGCWRPRGQVVRLHRWKREKGLCKKERGFKLILNLSIPYTWRSSLIAPLCFHQLFPPFWVGVIKRESPSLYQNLPLYINRPPFSLTSSFKAVIKTFVKSFLYHK